MGFSKLKLNNMKNIKDEISKLELLLISKMEELENSHNHRIEKLEEEIFLLENPYNYEKTVSFTPSQEQITKAIEQITIKMHTSIGKEKEQWITNYNGLAILYNKLPGVKYKLNTI